MNRWTDISFCMLTIFECYKGLDLMTNEADGTPAQRSCVTEFACELEFFYFDFQKLVYISK